MNVARIAAVVSIAAALVAIGGALIASSFVVILASTVVLIAGFVGAQVSSRAPAENGRGDTRAPKVSREASILIATLKNVENGSEGVAGDLQRVLSGIVADERGAIDRSEANTLIASFSKTDHAGAAVHAAQRMLSNVDAVSRRLGHDLRIAIAVHCGPRSDDTLDMASRVQSAATDSVPVLVSEPAARHLRGQLEPVDTIAGEGWRMELFTFPPAQRRLPGF